MKNTFALFALLAFLSACSGSGINSSIPALPPVGAAGNEVGQSCRKSEDSRRMYEVAPATRNDIELNPDLYRKLKQKRLDACASLEFQIDQDGRPFNIRLLKEKPKGYSVGALFIEQMKATRFDTPAKKGEWYFKNSVLLTSDE